MKKEQEGLLLLLKEIDQICKSNHITYYVSGGTVLGAVRHEGFIPWDDDIDVYMTRDNWKLFREVMKTQIPDDRALECWEDNEDCYNLLGRYINKATTQIHKYQLYSNTAMGQVIDVFVLDPVIKDKEVISQHQNNVMLASDLVNDFAIYSDRASSCEEYKELRARIDMEGRRKVVSEVVERLERYDEDEADCYVLRWGGMPHVFPKEMFGEPKYMKFEDMEVPLPSMICEHLILFYGIDWMYIPPHDDRLVHTTLFDYDQPFKRYADAILPRINRIETQRKMVNRKIEIFDNLQFTHDFDREKQLMEGEFVRKKLLKQVEDREIDIDKVSELKNPEEMRELLRDYIRMQTQKSFIGNYDFQGFYRYMNPIFIDIGDKLLASAMRIMIQDGHYSKVARLMKIREKEVSRPVEPCLKHIKFMIEGLAAVQSMVECRELRNADKLLDAIIRTEDNSKVYKYKLDLLQRMNEKGNTDEFRKLLQFCIDQWPDDTDFHKYKGDELYRDEEYDKALEEYVQTLRSSNNGLFALEIRKKIMGRYEIPERKEETHGAGVTKSAGFAEAAQNNAWFRLLIELTDICNRNQIEYCLGGGILYYLDEELLGELGPMPRNFSSIELIVDGANARKLIKACKNLPSDRTLECVLTNPKLRSLDMYYIDTKSTGVDFSRMDRKCSLGIALPIRVARIDNKKHNLKSSVVNDKLWMLNYGHSYKIPKLTQEERELNKQFVSKHKNGDRITRIFFKNNLKTAIEDDTKLFYVLNGNTRVRYNAKLYNKKRKAELFGYSLMVPADCERYLSTQFSSFKPLFHNATMILDESYVDHNSERDIYLSDEYWNKLDKQRQLSFKYSSLTEEHRNNWKMANEIFQEMKTEE